MERTLVCIGGGEIRKKETLAIDAYCATLAYRHAQGQRPMALFVPTASHDSKPYFNTFRKTYTSVFDIKADLVLTTRGGEMTEEDIDDKFARCNLIYVGAGDTLYMLQQWRQSGLGKRIVAAYKRGVPVVGLSAGAICWFEQMYTDSDLVAGIGSDYRVCEGRGLLRGLMSPHYNQRPEFDEVVVKQRAMAYAVEDKCALHWRDETLLRVVTCGGKAYLLDATQGILDKKELENV